MTPPIKCSMISVGEMRGEEEDAVNHVGGKQAGRGTSQKQFLSVIFWQGRSDKLLPLDEFRAAPLFPLIKQRLQTKPPVTLRRQTGETSPSRVSRPRLPRRSSFHALSCSTW